MNPDPRTSGAPPGDAGFFRHVLALISALLAYFRTRLHLIGLEGKEAAVHYLIIAALLVGALVVVVFGYFFVCFAIVFLIAWAIGGEHAWIWVTLGMGVLHLAAAAACVFVAKEKFAEPMFAASLEEFKKDQEWLRSQTAKPR